MGYEKTGPARFGAGVRERELVMDVLQAGQEWILGVLVHLVVSILVWGTVIAGLVLVVRDKVEEEDLASFLSKKGSDSEKVETCGELVDGSAVSG